MDSSLGKFDVPAASIPVIPLVLISVLVSIYEFLFFPVMGMITGHLTGITHLQRVGIGLVLSYFHGHCSSRESEEEERVQPSHQPLLALLPLCTLWDSRHVHACWADGVLQQ